MIPCASPELVQEVEVYRNYHSANIPMRVYLLVYDGSADHQRYLSFLKTEKEVRISPVETRIVCVRVLKPADVCARRRLRS